MESLLFAMLSHSFPIIFAFESEMMIQQKNAQSLLFIYTKIFILGIILTKSDR